MPSDHDEQGQVVVTAKTLQIDHIFGMIHSKKEVSVEDMNNAIVKGMLGGEDVDVCDH